jgi:hypothetical protein
MILIRVLVCLALFCLPFLVLIVLEGRPEALIYLMFPMFGAIPGILAALLIFAPLEWLLDRRGLGRLKNIAIPLAGALLIFVVALVIGSLSGKLGLMLDRITTGGANVVAPFLVWSVLGALWGGLWRFTAWVGTRLRRRFARPAA